MNQTITTSGCFDYPWNVNGGYAYPSVYYYHTSPVECSSDVHVFPCPHCDKCRCGKATVKREKKK